jgi:cell division protein FtsB
MSGPTPEDWKRRMDDSVETSMKILRVTNPRLAARLGDTESARALLESEARERALLESQARRRAIDELIPVEMRAKIIAATHATHGEITAVHSELGRLRETVTELDARVRELEPDA